jgi:tetratricopeptide (TPR) repeat protein
MKTDLRKAEEASSDSLAIQQRLAYRFPQVAEYQRDLALALNNLGALESHNDRLDRAEASYRKAIGIQEQLARKSPSVGQFRGDLAISYNNLGRALSQSERLADAQAAFESAETTLKQLLDDYPDDLAYRSSLAGILNNLGMVAEQQHRSQDAAKYYAQAIEHQRFAFERAGQVVQFRDFLRKHYSNYCRVLRSLDRHEEAIKAAETFFEFSKDDPEQLFRIAGELAEAAEKSGLEEKGADGDSLGDRYRNTAVLALEKALDAGLPHPERIAGDAAFESIRQNKRYESLSERLTKTP